MMVPELREQLVKVLELLERRLDATSRLPARRQRALARHLAAVCRAAAAGADPNDVAVQHRLVTIVGLLRDAEAAPPPPPVPAQSVKRLRRGSHLVSV